MVHISDPQRKKENHRVSRSDRLADSLSRSRHGQTPPLGLVPARQQGSTGLKFLESIYCILPRGIRRPGWVFLGFRHVWFSSFSRFLFPFSVSISRREQYIDTAIQSFHRKLHQVSLISTPVDFFFFFLIDKRITFLS